MLSIQERSDEMAWIYSSLTGGFKFESNSKNTAAFKLLRESFAALVVLSSSRD